MRSLTLMADRHISNESDMDRDTDEKKFKTRKPRSNDEDTSDLEVLGSRTFDNIRKTVRRPAEGRRAGDGHSMRNKNNSNDRSVSVLRRGTSRVIGSGRIRPKPPITYATTSRKSIIAQNDEIGLAENEEDALAKAIELSLSVDSAPADASSATAPHAPLKSLLDDIYTTTQTLESQSQSQAKLHIRRMLTTVHGWEGTIISVVHALEGAEQQRIDDIRGRLNFDRALEQRHQREVEQLLSRYEAKKLRNDLAHARDMEDMKHMYEAQIAERMQTNSQASSSAEVKSLQKYIVNFQEEHADTIRQMEAIRTTTVEVLKDKMERLCEENAALRAVQKHGDNGLSQFPEKRKIIDTDLTAVEGTKKSAKKAKRGKLD